MVKTIAWVPYFTTRHLPAEPTLEALLCWMEQSEFFMYKDAMRSASEKKTITPEEIRTLPGKKNLGGIGIAKLWRGFELHMGNVPV